MVDIYIQLWHIIVTKSGGSLPRRVCSSRVCAAADMIQKRKETIMNGNEMNGGISFEIVEELGVLAAYQTGWRKEVNLVSWNGGVPKYDIRDWAPDHDRMSRGITLHEKEMRLLVDSVRNRSRRRSYDSRHEETGSAVRREAADTASIEQPEAMERLGQMEQPLSAESVQQMDQSMPAEQSEQMYQSMQEVSAEQTVDSVSAEQVAAAAAEDGDCADVPDEEERAVS